jgi:hypothetical protein
MAREELEVLGDASDGHGTVANQRLIGDAPKAAVCERQVPEGSRRIIVYLGDDLEEEFIG